MERFSLNETMFNGESPCAGGHGFGSPILPTSVSFAPQAPDIDPSGYAFPSGPGRYRTVPNPFLSLWTISIFLAESRSAAHAQSKAFVPAVHPL